MFRFFRWPNADLSTDRARELAVKALANHWHKAPDTPVVPQLEFKQATVRHWATIGLSDRTEVEKERPGRPSEATNYGGARAAELDASRALDAYATNKRIEKALRRLIRRRGNKIFGQFEGGDLLVNGGSSEAAQFCPKRCSGGIAICEACSNRGGPKHLVFEETCGKCGGSGYVRGYMHAYTGTLTTQPGPYVYTYDTRSWVPQDIPCPAGCDRGIKRKRYPNPDYCRSCKGNRQNCVRCAGHGTVVTPVRATKIWTVLQHGIEEKNAPSRPSRRRSNALKTYGRVSAISLDLFRTKAKISSDNAFGYWAGKVHDTFKEAEFEICGKDLELFNVRFKKPPPPLWHFKTGVAMTAVPKPLAVPFYRFDFAATKVADFAQRLARILGF